VQYSPNSAFPPSCQNLKVLKNGCRDGVQRYYCKDCKHSWSDSLRTVGHPTIYDRRMTNAEKMARSRAKAKERLIDRVTDIDPLS
jgi:transposase-like protein